MLQEPPDYAPYGWSHCLTMPQAVMGIAGDGVDVPRATAVAATYVVGFRAALGQRALDPELDTHGRDGTPTSRKRAAPVRSRPRHSCGTRRTPSSPRSSPTSRATRPRTTTRIS